MKVIKLYCNQLPDNCNECSFSITKFIPSPIKAKLYYEISCNLNSKIKLFKIEENRPYDCPLIEFKNNT